MAARIRAVLRRSERDEPAPEGIQIGDLRLDPRSRTVTKGGAPIELSRKEFDLLALLMREAGAAVTRERLLEDVWKTTWFGSTKTLDVHVSGLRRKLGDNPETPRYLHTIRGVGFRFAGSDELRE